MSDQAHPYLPNSAPETKAKMLSAIGVKSIDALFANIPNALRMSAPLEVPRAFDSEFSLQRHMRTLLDRNTPASQVTSFLGGGCYPHYVPAVCSEVNSRAEFLTAYAGEPYEDHGKWQAIFEYCSLMADLLEMDVVTVPTYDGFQATATALRMAIRLTNRHRVLVPEAVQPDKLSKIVAYLEGAAEVVTVAPNPATGQLDAAILDEMLDDSYAAVLIETPNALGIVETAGADIAKAAHAHGTVVVASTDPVCLGFLPSPASWGADIVTGDIQSLGLGMHYGGAHGGFIAIHDEEEFIFELPSRLFGLAPTTQPGELGFTDVAYERTSLAMREEGIEWVGTAAALWGITAGVYLALLGPRGIETLGETVASLTRYAIEQIKQVDGVEVNFATSPHWRECVVSYRDHSVSAVNQALRDRGILGGIDVSGSCGLQRAALLCFTETHTKADIDRLVEALKEITHEN